MYEMFTGRVPFEADSYMGVLTKHMYMAPTPPSQLVGIEKLGVLEDIILRCLEKKPEHRYQTLARADARSRSGAEPDGPTPVRRTASGASRRARCWRTNWSSRAAKSRPPASRRRC